MRGFMIYKKSDVRCGKTLYYIRMFDVNGYVVDSIRALEKAQTIDSTKQYDEFTPKTIKEMMDTGIVFYSRGHARRILRNILGGL